MSAKKSNRRIQALALGLTAFVGVEQARAQTWYQIGATVEQINLTIDGSSRGENAGDITLNPYAGTPGGVQNPTGIIANPTGTPIGGGSIVNTVCTDINGLVYLGQAYQYSTVPYAGQSGLDPTWGAANTPAAVAGNGGNPVNPGQAAQAIQNAAFLYAGWSSSLTGGDIHAKAALQLAVWAALYDTGSGVAWGSVLLPAAADRFHIQAASGDATAIAEANWILTSSLGAGTGNSPKTYSGNLLKPTYQSETPGVNGGEPAQEMILTPTPVPEPTTVLAGMLLLLPFGASTLRFVRRHSAA